MFLLGMKSWCGQKSISIVVFPPPVYYFPPLLTRPKEFIFLIDFAATGIWIKLKTKIKYDFNQLRLFKFKGKCHFCLIVLVVLYWNFFVCQHMMNYVDIKNIIWSRSEWKFWKYTHKIPNTKEGEPVSNSAGSLCVKITRHETATPVSHSAGNSGKDPNTKYS